MIPTDPDGFARWLYARIPMIYRVEDAQRYAADPQHGFPLLALMRVIGEQAAAIRADLDELRDNFFIETCDDWVVPYLGALLGSSLLPTPVGRSNRLEVRDTVRWRRFKGTPRMLGSMAQSTALWPTSVVEFFVTLGWSQHMNHLARTRPLMPDLRDPWALSRLGLPDDPLSHAADFGAAHALEQPRMRAIGPRTGAAAFGTPGRYQIKNVGFFVRRLQPFVVEGATPAAAAPGVAASPTAACFTFDPLFRDVPLFDAATADPITLASMERSPWPAFGTDLAVRRFGVLLASDSAPRPDLATSTARFEFGGAGAGMRLHPQSGLRLMNPRDFSRTRAHVIVTAEWVEAAATTPLGELSTLLAVSGAAPSFQPGNAATGPGHLAITVRGGSSDALFPALAPASRAGWLPATVVAIRMEQGAVWRQADALYVYLPPLFVSPGATPQRFFVAADGSTYTDASLGAALLARASEGPVYPAQVPRGSLMPASFVNLHHVAGARIVDGSRFAGTTATIEVGIENSAGPLSFQLAGTVAGPAFAFAPSADLLTGKMPTSGMLTVRVRPPAGSGTPPTELIVTARGGHPLLVYLPAVAAGAAASRYFVAADGGTFEAPTDPAVQQRVFDSQVFGELVPGRAGLGQVLPIEGVWPLQQRAPLALNLCRCERRTLLRFGELGVDPERGRFAFAPGDPAIGQAGLTVDYHEAFSDRVGALGFDRPAVDRQGQPTPPPRRLVAETGDADTGAAPGATVHATLAAAIGAAADGDVIEIVDSATYRFAAPLDLANAAVRRLTIRSATRKRPCLSFYQASGAPTAASIRVGVAMSNLSLTGLLVSGGAIVVDAPLDELDLAACTLDPGTGAPGSILSHDHDPTRHGEVFLCRCITGGVLVGAGVERVAMADSIVDRRGALAIGGLPSSPPASPPASAGAAAASVQLERVSVLGQIHTDRLDASDCLLDEVAIAEDQQVGCVRFTRYEVGSQLPRRFQCVPDEASARTCRPGRRCVAPIFNSRRFGRPDYAQLAAACPPEILAAGENGAEVGAFSTTLGTIRLSNLRAKQQEFMPAGLSAVIIALT